MGVDGDGDQPKEVSSIDLKKEMAQTLDDVMRGETVYVTRHGRRVAALVPVEIAETAHGGRQRGQDDAGLPQRCRRRSRR